MPKRISRRTQPNGLPEPLEADIQRQILDYLRLIGACVWRQNSGGMTRESNGKTRYIAFTSVKGVSDIIGVYRGRGLAIEVKRPGGVVTEQQQQFLDDFNRAGGLGIVARSLDDVVEALKTR